MRKNIINKMFLQKKDSSILKSHEFSTWGGAKNRLLSEVWPEYTPTFKIVKSDKIFTIGSCFARNIEDYLVELGYHLPMKLFSVPKVECPNLRRPNGILNKFSPTAIFQEINWCEQIYLEGGKVTFKDIEKFLYACNDERVIDLHIGCYVPVSKERAYASNSRWFCEKNSGKTG